MNLVISWKTNNDLQQTNWEKTFQWSLFEEGGCLKVTVIDTDIQ